jgi:hypothetical protein
MDGDSVTGGGFFSCRVRDAVVFLGLLCLTRSRSDATVHLGVTSSRITCMTHDTHDSGVQVQYHPVASRLKGTHALRAVAGFQVGVMQVVMRCNIVVLASHPQPCHAPCHGFDRCALLFGVVLLCLRPPGWGGSTRKALHPGNGLGRKPCSGSGATRSALSIASYKKLLYRITIYSLIGGDVILDASLASPLHGSPPRPRS